jgi:hypothetical protein
MKQPTAAGGNGLTRAGAEPADNQYAQYTFYGKMTAVEHPFGTIKAWIRSIHFLTRPRASTKKRQRPALQTVHRTGGPHHPSAKPFCPTATCYTNAGPEWSYCFISNKNDKLQTMRKFDQLRPHIAMTWRDSA